MTSYAVDEGNNLLMRIWPTALGQRAAVVSRLPRTADGQKRLSLAAALTSLSEALWRSYTRPAPAGIIEVNSEGWRRQQSREAFIEVAPAIKQPNLSDEDGFLLVSYEPVEEFAHCVGRALHAINDAKLAEAVSRDVAAELEAVESAERGELGGRAVQAVVLSRADASPVQVAAADKILKQNPLAGEQLFSELDSTAASVAAAHWLKAAADVVADVSGLPAEEVLLAADDIEALACWTPTEVLELFKFGSNAYEIVVKLVSDAMLLAEGVVSDLSALLVKHEGKEVDDDEVAPVRLTPLDPRRPARDLLEDLLGGIYGCRLLFAEYAGLKAHGQQASVDDTFCTAVRDKAEANSGRLM